MPRLDPGPGPRLDRGQLAQGSTDPTVGVVIPVRDGATWIDQALASVAGQSQEVDAVVVVDDGSSDDTVEVAQRWSSLLPLEVLSSGGAGLGPGPARALGIEHLSTTLVALLDADDVWLPDHLALMTAHWRRHGGLVTADAWRWVEGQAVAGRPWSRRFPVPRPGRQLDRLISANYVFVGTLFSRSLYHHAGGFGDVLGTEDWDLWLRMVAAGAVVSRPAVPSVLYRVRPDGLTGSGCLPAAELATIDGFLASSCPPELRRQALRRRRRCAAALALQEGYASARQGHREATRRAAGRAAWGGGPWVRVIGLGMAIAPGWVVAYRDQRHRNPGWLVSR